ncbi:MULTISPECIES: hypothetical protein [unclassified Streptomyces]|uniref:hypothetical protein n=1 Tax=unclassified Streptomyces TaxID=2593676 RepID=UPI003665D839
MVDPSGHVADLCAHLDLLRRFAPREAEQLVSDALAGHDVGQELADLLLRLEIPETADADRSSPVGPALVGGFGRHSAHEVFRCPGGRCSRAHARLPAAPAPVCHLQGSPLRLTRD